MSIVRDTKLHRFILEQKWACAGLILSLIALLTLTFNNLAEAIYFDDPRHQNVQLKAWMTPRYIGMSYDLPRVEVLNLLEIEEGSNFPKRLDRDAERLGITLDELTAKVREAAAVNRTGDND